MNILQVSVPEVYPPTKGGDHRKHGLVTSFPDAGDQVFRYSQGGEYQRYTRLELSKTVDIREGYCELQRLHPIFEASKLPVLLGWPYTTLTRVYKYYTPPELVGYINWADIVLVEGPWQVPTVAKHADVPVVYSSHNVEAEHFDHLTDSLFGDWIHQQVINIEQQAIDYSDAIVCTSVRDKQQFQTRYDVNTPMFVIPNGTYEETIGGTADDRTALKQRYEITGTHIAIFMGSRHPPNVEAVQHSIDALGALIAEGIEIDLLIVGEVGNQFDTTPPYVTTTGFVEDLDFHLNSADIALNPVTFGGGTNVKMFDYFGAELPVVTTPYGIRGIEAEDGVHCTVREIDELTDGIRELLSNPNLQDTMASEARYLVEKRYTWSSISATYRQKLRSLIADQIDDTL